MRRLASSVLVGTLVAGMFTIAASSSGTAANVEKPTYIYGIDDSNIIWETDPSNQSPPTKVNVTGLPGVANSNAMAYDTERDQFLFTYSGAAPAGHPELANSLLFWDQQSNNQGPDSLKAIGKLTSFPGSASAANAAYYKDAYWYFTGNTQTLNKVAISYTAGEPTGTSLVTYNLSQYAAPVYPANYGYGDIAITSAGILYGNTTGGKFFTIDLNKLGDRNQRVFTALPDTGKSLQLSFNPDYSILYAQNYEGGKWYTVDQTSGALTDIGYTTAWSAKGFRDLGGAATTQAGTECIIAPPGNTQDQTAHIGEAVPLPLKVYVGTTDGFPQENVEVIFRVTSGGGNLAGATEVAERTNANGIATAPDWILGNTPGANTVQVDNTGTACDFTFNATAILGPTPAPNPEPDPTPGPGPGPDPTPQEPTKPLNLPTTVRDEGVTTLVKLPIETNAGQYVRAKAICVPLVRNRPAADVGVACRVFQANQRLKVWVSGKIPVGVTLRLTAPANGDFSSYKKLKQYVTKAVK